MFIDKDKLLDDTYSDIRNIINFYCRDGHYDPASLLVVRKIIEVIADAINKEEN